MTMYEFDTVQLDNFEHVHDMAGEDFAAQARGEFLEKFPLDNLPQLTIHDYVIGYQKPTFCTYVESKTRTWASIQGATSEKFGIYFGKEKNDPEMKYRFARRLGETQDVAFRSVKNALLDLIRLGQADDLDFLEIDKNLLSQMFKAKILCLYFPEKFLNICSADHLNKFRQSLELGHNRSPSECQNLLMAVKRSNQRTRMWSNPKFMSFLYHTYLPKNQKDIVIFTHHSDEKIYPEINFEDIQAQKNAIGKAAELYALDWEKQRLEGLGFTGLVSQIVDQRARPGYGYDFLSHTSPGKQRFIEVKAIRKISNSDEYRFFLSLNEHKISQSEKHKQDYFFYLVSFDKAGKPSELFSVHADQIYKKSRLLSAAYVVYTDVRAGEMRVRS